MARPRRLAAAARLLDPGLARERRGRGRGAGARCGRRAALQRRQALCVAYHLQAPGVAWPARSGSSDGAPVPTLALFAATSA